MAQTYVPGLRVAASAVVRRERILPLKGDVVVEEGQLCKAEEVVARTEHLGASKRRLMRYRTSSDSAAVGDKLTVDGKNAGEVVNVAGNKLLAVTPVALHE